jgi:putative DNA primase/helicase
VSGSAFQDALRHAVPDLARELLGRPTLTTRTEWRWRRRGSLSVVVVGNKVGHWYDHEAGAGGGFVDLVARELGTDRDGARDWIKDRIGHHAPTPRRAVARKPVVTAPAAPCSRRPAKPDRATHARNAGEANWRSARPASDNHPYLQRKGVRAHGLRCDAAGNLLVPLRDLAGTLYTLEFIRPDGTKRYLPGGAKRGHFCVMGGPLAANRPILICEGWATGASLHEATGDTVVAAMDAGNLLPVAEALRAAHPTTTITIVGDNDAKPGRVTNPGVAAARNAARAIGGWLAIPTEPGDANDLALLHGLGAVAEMVVAAVFVPDADATYAAPVLSVAEARAQLEAAVSTFMEDVSAHWIAWEKAEREKEARKAAGQPVDSLFIDLSVIEPVPPRIALPVDVGLGKTRAAREAIAMLIANGGLQGRKVVYAVPRHDLGAEQVAAFAALGVRAMLWKGRTAPDPTPENAEQLMCLDPGAIADALEVEQPIEQSCCSLRRDKRLHHVCRLHGLCGYQAQKARARAAAVVVTAHDSLFHIRPSDIGKVGLLVIDEAFWQAGLRGLDGKTQLTLDGLAPDAEYLTCHDRKGAIDWEASNDLSVLRGRLWRVLDSGIVGPIPHALLVAAGLSPDDCRTAATLERRRARDPGILPGMDATTRRRRVEKVLPPFGAPWAPPGRAATMWLILADALEHGRDAGSVTIAHESTDSGTVRVVRLRWRSTIRGGWVRDVPVLHLDATLREALVKPYLPSISVREPVRARLEHVTVRQVLGTPTSARALTPDGNGQQRLVETAARNLRDLDTYIRMRARELTARPGSRILVVGQKSAIDALGASSLPATVVTAHFNALSGLDRWNDVAGLVVLGRTLPAPATVETLAMALTNDVSAIAGKPASWWYESTEKRIRLANGRTRPIDAETHPDPTAEAIRWSICEAELIQAIGRGRAVNRTADTPLAIDLLTDVVLPMTVDEVLEWDALRPTRQDVMAASGVVLENAADMARCFPDLWPNREAAKKDNQRRGTNGYYRILYNSEMSPSSALVTYQPEGAGQKPRQATFDLTNIADPEAWLRDRLGPLAACEVIANGSVVVPAVPVATLSRERLIHLTNRLDHSVDRDLRRRREALDDLAARLASLAPVREHSFHSQQERPAA